MNPGIVCQQRHCLHDNIHALHRQHTAEVQHDKLLLQLRRFHLGTGIVDAGVCVQIQGLDGRASLAELCGEIVPVGVGVADNMVCQFQRPGVDPVAELCPQRAGTQLFPVADHSVIDGDEKVDIHRLFPETVRKQRQHQLRRKAQEHRIKRFHGHGAEFSVHMEQPLGIALLPASQNGHTFCGLFDQPDFLGVPEIVQVFGGDEQHILILIRLQDTALPYATEFTNIS